MEKTKDICLNGADPQWERGSKFKQYKAMYKTVCRSKDVLY